ncbi:isoleucyl-tRNA synthetase [Deinobacterium chartae]|uniref:Isoleucine--tRNA ligase n=1 Tax=Deinobacterium chartae TaxID=521158 RepID=A0A841HXP5_9DEIO|nr:isoleucyl-tRNA synthetase [Deinobacterium chartae]
MFKPVESNPNFPNLERDVLEFWRNKNVFKRSLEKDGPVFSFFEGPPTANGTPGIHHVQARSYKDLFPRFKTMQGYRVPRKAGWDTHGLPVELAVEKKLGLSSKREVEAYGIDKFNAQCRESVFEYEHIWREFTERMGYWVDLDDAYMTLHKDYIESVWWSLKQLAGQDLLYKGFRVAPYCPKDGTTLSNAEVSEGYKDIQDPSIYLTFDLVDPARLGLPEGSAFLVWTTTPWTVPYNVGVALNPDFTYLAVRDTNGKVVILAESLKNQVLGEDAEVVKRFAAPELEGARYHPPFREAYDLEGDGQNAWQAGLDSYVTAEDGTGIVHTAPAFGEDDLRLARKYGFPIIVGVDSEGKHRFGPWKGVFFRDANSDINRALKEKGVLWKLVNFNHAYPHCWRCGTPLMYYATESWFVRNTARKERLIELNGTINWLPAHIRTGRYGAWLENLVDWNLSRNRYWGTPLPIWETASGRFHVVGSYAELAELSRGAINPFNPEFDPHRPFIDDVVLYHPETGEEMRRVPYVIDVWYDSGSMPFAQFHYPFENKEAFEGRFPADYIAEAIDQTRGWFNTLHQLGTLLFDSVAYKTVICHGHILDEKGNKMSKSKGNIVDPWAMFEQYGADATRWYMFVSAPPELSRRFGPNLVAESFKNYFLTLWNTYSFFVMYANLDQPDLTAAPPVSERPEVDRWLLAKLQELIQTVTERLEAFDPTGSSRAIQDFVVEDLSNWYVRRNRRRFWRSEGEVDTAAYATLHQALVTVTQLTAPFTPFVAEMLYQNLVLSVDPMAPESVHLSRWPTVNASLLNPELVEQMDAVIKVVSLGRAVRGQTGIKTRQPLPKVLLRARTREQTASLGRFREQIAEELNVKNVELLEQFADLVSYQLKPNLPVVGKKYGKQIPLLKKALEAADPSLVARSVREDRAFEVEADGVRFELQPNEVLVDARSPEGMAAIEDAGYLVAFDTTVTRELLLEGLARDVVRAVQNARKDAGLEVSDRIRLSLLLEGDALEAAREHRDLIAGETLAEELLFGAELEGTFVAELEGGRLALARL